MTILPTLTRLVEEAYPETLLACNGGYFLISRDRKIVRFSLKCQSLFHYTESQVLGESLSDLLPNTMSARTHDILVDSVFEKFDLAIQNEEAISLQSMGVDQEGKPRIVKGTDFNGDPIEISIQFGPILNEKDLYIVAFVTEAEEVSTELVIKAKEEGAIVIKNARVNMALGVADAVGDRFSGGFNFLTKNVFGSSRAGRIISFIVLLIFYAGTFSVIGFFAVEYFKKPPTNQNIRIESGDGGGSTGGAFDSSE